MTSLPGVLFVEEAHAHNLVYGVEAHIGSLAPRPKAAAKLIEDVPGLTLTLDLCIGLPDAEVEPLVEHASHFHARGGRRGRLQERFTRNTIDYGRIVDVMGQTGYRGWLGIEYV